MEIYGNHGGLWDSRVALKLRDVRGLRELNRVMGICTDVSGFRRMYTVAAKILEILAASDAGCKSFKSLGFRI